MAPVSLNPTTEALRWQAMRREANPPRRAEKLAVILPARTKLKG
jgi:hypothetical protein